MQKSNPSLDELVDALEIKSEEQLSKVKNLLEKAGALKSDDKHLTKNARAAKKAAAAKAEKKKIRRKILPGHLFRFKAHLFS